MSRRALKATAFVMIVLVSGCGGARNYAVRGSASQSIVEAPPGPLPRPREALQAVPAVEPPPMESMTRIRVETSAATRMAPEPPAIRRDLPPLPPDLEQASDESFRIDHSPVAVR